MHGWPSFRDDEVDWDFVRVLPDGETVSMDGTHLGHNLPDRYVVCLTSRKMVENFCLTYSHVSSQFPLQQRKSLLYQSSLCCWTT
jgi:hypothetical protein